LDALVAWAFFLIYRRVARRYDGAAGAEKADAEEESSGKRRPPGAGQGSSRRVALEFVKTVSHVLSLDGEAQKEASTLC
jgi:hypothetical protein